jgi:hypothetical protein
MQNLILKYAAKLGTSLRIVAENPRYKPEMPSDRRVLRAQSSILLYF